MKRKAKKVIVISLVVLLLIGVASISAFAIGVVNAVSGAHVTIPAGEQDNGWRVVENGFFCRCSLVHFPNGIEGDNWRDYTVRASIDIIQEDVDVTDTRFFRTNMLDYYACGEGAESDAEVKKAWGLYAERNHLDTWSDVVVRTTEVFGENGADSFAAQQDACDEMVAKYQKNKTNPVRTFFSSLYPTEGYQNEMWPKYFNDMMDLTGPYHFTSDGQDYWFLEETGIIVEKDGYRYALTLRDFAAFEYVQEMREEIMVKWIDLLVNFANNYSVETLSKTDLIIMLQEGAGN